MNILFVDDEVHILRSIQRLMVSRSYKTFYAASGAEALRLLETQAVDVVVSDMMMPEMNGYDLLLKIRNTRPSVARVIVSGYAHAELIQRAVMQGIAAAYLVKPLDVETLVMVLEQCRLMREAMGDSVARDVLIGLGQFPVLSDCRERILTATGCDVDAAEMARLIEGDPAVTVNVLRLANSVTFGRSVKVGSVREAVVRIGVIAIKSVVLTSSIIDEAHLGPEAMIRIRAILDNSLKINRLVHFLHHHVTGVAVLDIARSVGQVHDIGMLLMETRMPVLAGRMLEACAHGMTGGAAELHAFSAGHAKIGGCLLDYWSFPRILVAGALYHHSPLQECISKADQIVLCILHIVDSFVWSGDVRHPVLNMMPENEQAYAYIGKSREWVLEALRHECETEQY